MNSKRGEITCQIDSKGRRTVIMKHPLMCTLLVGRLHLTHISHTCYSCTFSSKQRVTMLTLVGRLHWYVQFCKLKCWKLEECCTFPTMQKQNEKKEKHSRNRTSHHHLLFLSNFSAIKPLINHYRIELTSNQVKLITLT